MTDPQPTVRGITIAPQPSIALQPDPLATMLAVLATLPAVPLPRYELRGGLFALAFFMNTLPKTEPDPLAIGAGRIGQLCGIPAIHDSEVEPGWLKLVNADTGEVLGEVQILQFDLAFTPPPTDLYVLQPAPVDFGRELRLIALQREIARDIATTPPSAIITITGGLS